MKRLLVILGTFFVLAAMPFVGATFPCYQETATQAPTCGGASGGSYSTTGSWAGCTSSLYDGNWSTGCYAFYAAYGSEFNATYSMPANYLPPGDVILATACSNVVGSGPIYRFNSTIPHVCLNSTTGNLTVNWNAMDYATSTTSVIGCYAYNGNLVTIATLGNASADCSDPVEEGVWWPNTLDNCSLYTIQTLNFNLRYESNQSLLNGNLNLWISNASYDNFSQGFSGSSNYSLCMNSTNATYTINGIGQYYATGFSYRNYYLTNAIINNVSQNINLYLLENTSTTSIIMRTRDNFGNPISGVIIYAQEYYIANNSYVTVSTAQTDYNGNTLMNLNAYNTMYKFILYQNGAIVYQTTYPMQITLDIITNGINFNIQPNAYGEVYRYINNIAYSCQFNNATGVISCYVVDTSGLMTQACMQIKKYGALNLTTLYQGCVNSSGSVLTYNLGNYTGNRYVYSLWVNYPSSTYLINQATLDFSTAAIFAIVGSDAIIIMIVIMVFCSTAAFFSPNPIVPLAMSLISLIAGFILGLAPISWGGVVSLITVAGILAVKMRL